MPEVRYGFVDDGAGPFVPLKKDGTQALEKVTEIVKDAPENLDTFKEVADEFQSVNDKITAIEGINHEEFATKEWVGKEIDSIVIPTKVSDLENDAKYQTEAEVNSRIETLIGAAPEALDTLEEIAAKLQEDSDAVEAINGVLEGKASKEELADAVKDSVKYLEFGESRKTIQLANDDNITGIDTKGVGRNLVMLSKWNIADFGAAGVHLNLNTVDDITINGNNGENGAVVATNKDIEIVREMIPSVEGLASETWVEGKGYLTEHQDISDLATKEEVSSAVAAIEIPEEYDDTEIKERLTALEGIDHGDFATKEEMATALDEKQDKGKYLEYTEQDGRKVVTLNNADIIGAVANEGELEYKYEATGWQSVIQLNRWNVVDCGSPRALFNINIPDGERPTVQEASQSGPEAHKIAYLNDVADKATKEDIQFLKSLINSLANKSENTVVNANSVSGESVTIDGGFILNDKGKLTQYTASAGDIVCSSLSVEKSTLEFTAKAGNVTLSNIKSEGDVRSNEDNDSRNGVVVFCNGDVSLKDSELYQDGYNMVHFNMNGTAASKSITVENVKFGETLNNGIIVFATDDDAVVTIKNVTIGEAKNAVRFSNFLAKTCVTVNLENVEVGSVREKFMLLEDYRTRNHGEYPSDSTDIFDAAHMTFNFKNVTVGGVKLTADMDKSEYMHMVVGRPSLGLDIDVTETCKGGLTFNFID